jgi:hypothetical protein
MADPAARLVRGPDGVVHQFPADATDAEISNALSAPPVTARGKPARSWTDLAVDTLPAAAGTLGGIVGGIGGTVAGMGVGGVPGAVGGAALGGAAGEALKQLINRARGAEAPATPFDAAKGIATQGAVQGASEAAGAGLMKGASMAAHGLMDFAIRPAPTLAEDFGDIAGTALKERLPVGNVLPGAKKGSQITKAALRDSAQTTRALVKGAEDAGTTFSAQDIAKPVTDLAANIAKQPISESETRQLSRMFMDYIRENPAQLTPTTVKDMKQAAQRIAKPIFRAINAGNPVPAGESLKASFNKAIADGAKDALETIPGVGASEARTQGLIGATKAIRRAEVRRMPLVAEIATPTAAAMVGGAHGLMSSDVSGATEGAGRGITAAMLLRALLSPRSTSRMALGLTEPAIQQVIRQMPRGAVYALLDQVTGPGSAPVAGPPETPR